MHAEPKTLEAGTAGVLDYLGILRTFKFTFLLAIVAGLGLALVMTVRQTPKYRATLQMEVQDLNQNFLNIRELDPSAAPGGAAPDAYIQVQSQVLQSTPLFERVIRRLRLDQRPDYLAQRETPLRRLALKLGAETMLSAAGPRYAAILRRTFDLPPSGEETPHAKALRVAASNLKVRAAAQSSLVELSYTAPDAATPAEFLNALAEEYIALTMEARWNGTERTAEWLRARLRDMRDNLEKAERKLQTYARDSGMLYRNERESVGEEKLRQVQAELSRAQADRATRQARFERIAASAPEQLPEVLDDQRLRDSYTRLADLQRDLSGASASMKPDHPQVRALESQIATLRTAIRNEVGNVVGRIRNEYEASVRRETLLHESYQKQFQTVAEQAGGSVPYHVLAREVESKRQFYQEMLQKVDSAGVATAIRASNIRVVNAAQVPLLPYRPDLVMNLVIGGGCGMLLGLVGCFLRESARRRSRTLDRPGQGAELLNVPELGTIPSVKRTNGRRWLHAARPTTVLGSDNERSQLVEWRKNTPLLADSCHATLDSLLYPGNPAERPQIVLITSALPLEGKTTVAGCLAMALADIGKRVLLIDADMRKPDVHVQFRVALEPGLGNLLDGSLAAAGSLDRYISRAHGGVDVMPAGVVPGNVARLLALGRFDPLLNELRGKYEIILIDTPPVLLFPDARVLGRHADGVVLVVRSNHNPREVHQEATEVLQHSGSLVLGTVLNDWTPASRYYPGRYYDQYARR